MYRKLLLLLFILIPSIPLFAQLEVKEGSFKEVPGFVNINLDPNYQTDDNDLPFAVIKVKTENITDKQRRDLKFEGNGGTFIVLEYKTGEVWVYVTAKYADYLKISHPDLSSTEFTLPFDLSPKHGYELTLVNKSNPIVNGWASLTIKTKPEIGANIMLNGRAIDEITPHTNSMIPSGKYEITVSKERYKTVTEIVEINDGDIKVVEIPMLLDVAVITLTADNQTEIFINGEYRGKGEWSGELYSGNYDVVCKKPYHKDLQRTIIVEGGVPQKYDFKLEPIYGIINVDSEPSGANIIIDGKKHGVTPATINNVMIGRHELRLDKNGYGIITKTFTLEENKPITIKENLPDGQEITLTTGNTSAEVYIDGEPVGKSPVTKVVSFGRHTITAYTDNKSATNFINITREDAPREINLVLRKESIASFAKPGYKFITINGAMSQYGDMSYGLTFGSMRKFGWFASVTTNFSFATNYDYVCDAAHYVTVDGNTYYPEYTGTKSYSSLSVMGGALMRLAGPVVLRVGAGYGARTVRYKTNNGYWVKNQAISANGLDMSLGLQCNFRGFIISFDCVTTNFKTWEAKIGLGYGLKSK
ncbi:MAG: PEGA domain-containing protein [Bacteroidales bacterium]|nr:PEGA domain-containing protein [Bacteroidales bacterium]